MKQIATETDETHVRLMGTCLLALIALAHGCTDCDQSLCEEECEEAYPDDAPRRDACYLDCAAQAEECRRR